MKSGDVVTRTDAGPKHILVVKDEEDVEHVYPLYASTLLLRQAEIKSLLRTMPFVWTSAYDATRNDA